MPDRQSHALMLLIPVMLAALSAPLHARTPSPPATNAALEPLLAGEFALQAGKLDEAAKHYLDAARLSGDTGLAERATRIALLANEDRVAREALALWKRGGQPPLALTASEATLAVRGGHADAAASSLEKLLRDPDPRGWRYALVALSGGGKDTQRTGAVLKRLRERGALPTDMDAQLAFAGLAQRLQQQALVDALVLSLIHI